MPYRPEGEAMNVLEGSTALDPDAFRALMRRQAAMVTVVTVAGSPPAGFTATSFTLVSLRPPLVSVALSRHSSSWPALKHASHLGVHLLGEEQHEVARTFATSGIDRFAAHGAWRSGPYGVPLLESSVAWLLCRVTQQVSAGEHTLVLAEPIHGAHARDGAPLIRHMGRYVSVTQDPPTNGHRPRDARSA
jgi:flavin reductase (DIM6/NTAB) family NADH-FMN oxidoreductase RutF